VKNAYLHHEIGNKTASVLCGVPISTFRSWLTAEERFQHRTPKKQGG
jgi:hypothetical protein